MRFSVLGCGRWGSFIAWYLNRIGMEVTIWGRPQSQRIIELQTTHKNKYVSFDNNVKITTDLRKTIETADVMVVSISAQHLRELAKRLATYDLSNKTLILCMKGLEQETGKRLSQVVKDYCDIPVAIWVGPGHVEDFTKGIPNCMVIDSDDNELKEMLVKQLSSNLIRFYFGSDMIGNEVGAAAKNVIGIAAGMLDGVGKTSLKGALMSRGTREIARLIKAMGGKEISAYGLAHLGDYQATLFSEFSHNRMFGERFIKGEKYVELAEGAATVKALLELGKKYEVELPICEAVKSMIYDNEKPEKALSKLFERSLKNEF